jgi:hypothetical protein
MIVGKLCAFVKRAATILQPQCVRYSDEALRDSRNILSRADKPFTRMAGIVGAESRGESALRSFAVERVEERGRNTYLRLVDISVNNISLDSAPEHGVTSATVMTVCIAARFVSGVVVPQPELHVL